MSEQASTKKPDETADTSPAKPGTAIDRMHGLPPEIRRTIEENRMRNAVVAQIRGTIWGKNLNAGQMHAVAQYAREVGIDPVRHVEVLGGRIYLTSEYYQEKGAPLVRSGEIELHETEYIQDDPRLDELAIGEGTVAQWAAKEKAHRQMQRIKYGVDERAAAAAIVRLTVRKSGTTFVGVSWCGGGSRKGDPVGDAEPTKTAETRAARRAWKRIVSVIPELEREVAPVQARAEIVQAELVEQAATEVQALPRTTQIAGHDDEYGAPSPVPLPLDGPKIADPYSGEAA